MFRKLKSVVVFLKIIVSFVLTRPFGKIVSDFAFKTRSVLPTASKAYYKVLHTKSRLKYFAVLSQQSLFRIRFHTIFAAIF